MDNQYGDCKDKHTLLAAMLEAIGLHPDAVLIGAGIRFNQAVPSPDSFNHLITRVEVDGKPVWLDTTAEVAPYRLLLFGIRDRSALVVPDMGLAKVEKTPALPPFEPTTTMEAVGTLDADGTSNSKITFTFRGDDEVIMRSLVRRISPSQYEQMAKGMLGGIGYQGEPSHVEVNRPEDTTVPMLVAFDYKRVKGGDWDNHRVLAQLSPVLLTKPDESDPPVEAIELGVPRVESSKATMKLPEGWGTVLPDAIHEESKWATLDETYSFKKGVLSSERKLVVLKDRVPQAEWKEYAKFAEAINLGNERYVQLVPHDEPGTKTTTIQLKVDPPAKDAIKVQSMPAQGGSTTAMADQDPEILIRQAKAMQGVMGQSAQSLLDSVKAKHPEQQGLWSGYGQLAEQRGNLSEAVDDYLKELSLHPAEYGTYGPLAEAQWTLKQRADAEATLRTWMSADPTNSEAPLKLAGHLLEDGKPAESATTAKAGLAGMAEDDPERGRLEVLLGQAELAAGDKDGARKALVSAMKSAKDAEISNDAAYALADAGIELTLAEVTTSQNVSHMEEESRDWTLTNYPVQMETRQMLLESSWETMAWVLFREGNAKDAETYARAVWLGRPTMLAGENLGEIEEANGDRAGALTTYELALSASGSDAEKKALQGRIDLLRSSGVATEVKDGAADLAKLRVFPLGAGGDMDGTSEYQVTISGGKVEAAKAVGGKWVRGGEELVAAAAMPGLVPKGSKARLVRMVKLTCKQKSCELVLGE
jgi:tetratricopeptide (TPR) repeat protein